MKYFLLRLKMFFFKIQYGIILLIMRPKVIVDKDTKKAIKNHKKPFIVVYNHIGYYDATLLCSVFLSKYLRLIATDEILKNRISKFFFGWNGVITIDRDNMSLAAYSQIRRSLKAGFWIGIAPEGHINRTTELLEFKTGAAQIALSSKTDVLPVYMVPNRKVFWQRQIVRIGSPLTLKGDKQEATAQLKESIKTLAGRG